MYQFAIKKLELADSSPLGKSKYCPWVLFGAALPAAAAAIPQHTADKAAPGSCSSLHRGSPPG